MDHREPASIEFHSYQQSSYSSYSSILSSFAFQKLSETVFIILLNILKMFWNALFHPLPYYTAPTTPNSRLLTPLVYLYWAVMCCVLLPLAPIYLFTSLVGTIYISTQMGWRLKQTKPEVIEDIKKRYLGSVSITVTPPAEPTPVAEPAPVVESPPVVESIPEVESVPVVGSVPEVESTPVAESIPVVESTPVAESIPEVESVPEVESAPAVESVPVVEPVPIVAEPVLVVIVEEVVEEKTQSGDDTKVVPQVVVEEAGTEDIVPLAIEPALTVEESPVKLHEFILAVDEEVQAETPIRETHEEIPQVLAKQESLTMREYTSPIVAGFHLEDVEERLAALLHKARGPVEQTKHVCSCSMMESKSTTESAPSDYSESTSSDIDESDEDELEERKYREEQGLEEIMEEEEADEIIRKDPDEPEVSDQELTPQAPEYIPPAPQVKPEEPVFVPPPRVYGPPAFGICEKRGVREIVDPRERHSHQAWIQQPVSASMEESLASSDESSPYDDESERDGSPPISPISSVGGIGNWGGIIESLGKIVELDIGAEKADSVRDDVDTSVIPAPLAPQKTETPQVTEVLEALEAPALEVKEVSPCVAPVEPVPTTIEPEKQATIVDEQKLMPVVEIAPKLERSNTNDSGFESGSVKEVKVQKKKKKVPMKQRLGNKKSKRSW
ncbi:hypothetical protein L873DRAFT_789455 [Choiromyces venosus 120613-1]|uniref:Uncharacterized protein n=1 Tax=Choiromyces venosus 120613-1 TaxID=1336337 RepID=A0A3N4KAG2_9PEZI|nr:hypothetical protein L873DRAFT_789455 [Choiromyces venosus 120613-1]